MCRNGKLSMCDVTVHNRTWNGDLLCDSCDNDLREYGVWRRTHRTVLSGIPTLKIK